MPKCTACGRFKGGEAFAPCPACGLHDLCPTCLEEHGCLKKAGSIRKFSASITSPIAKLAASVKAAAEDGLAWFLYFPMGMAPMDEEDWRQWELTPENATLMVADATTRLQAGEIFRISYTHVDDGPKAGEVRGFELRPEGIFCGAVWTPTARASITSTPSEWDGFSPEFYAQSPFDQDGNSLMFNGRTILRPFRIDETAGALTNRPSMVGLKVAASMAPNPPREGEKPKEDAMSNELEAMVKSLQSDLASLRTSMDSNLEAAKKTNEAQTAEIARMKASRDLEDLIAKGRRELRITEANVANVREHFEKFGLPAAEAFVAALPASAPRGGSVLAGNFGGKATPAPAANADPSPADHLDASAGWDADRLALHQAAVGYVERSHQAGRKVTYGDAIIAITKAKSA